MLTPECDYDAYESAPDPQTGEQFLMRVYRRNGPIIRTVCWRSDVGATWGPEHILFAVRAELSL